MKKLFLFIFLLIFAIPTMVFADAKPGDVIIILGENLSATEKQLMEEELGAKKEDLHVTVSNAEEHKYLGNYISKAQIGKNAISSAKITLTEKGSGLKVESKNINWVTDDMYSNSLLTAGIKDAEIYVTSPREVSGTAALTGIIKAYEISTDKIIPEEKKQVANEEMVKTAQLGERIGTDEASAIMTSIKEELAKNPDLTRDELRTLINGAAQTYGVSLTDQEINALLDLFERMQNANIDWNAVKDDLVALKDNVSAFLEKEENRNFINSILDGLIGILDWLKGLFR